MADIRFHYFSVAVRNLEAGMKRYEEYFGLRPVGEITEQRWGFRGVMLGTDEGPMLEMIEPTRFRAVLKEPAIADCSIRYLKDRKGSVEEHSEDYGNKKNQLRPTESHRPEYQRTCKQNDRRVIFENEYAGRMAAKHYEGLLYHGFVNRAR